jgi:hypothetical protein
VKPAGVFVAVLLFVVLATANSGGYRYGISDQAFYIPAVNHHLAPNLFPRDAALIEAQARLVASDELLAAAVRTTGLSLPLLAVILYFAGLILFIVAAAAFARGLGYSWWAVTLFGVLLTFRHRIAKTGANSPSRSASRRSPASSAAGMSPRCCWSWRQQCCIPPRRCFLALWWALRTLLALGLKREALTS